MTSQIPDTSQRNAARVAGFMFLFALLIPLLNWVFVLSKLFVPENAIAPANNVISNEFQFRLGITIELIMAIGLIVLGFALYTILKEVNKNIALLALLLKALEAAIAAAIVLVSFVSLHILVGDPSVASIESEHLKVPVGLILNGHFAIFSIPMVFLGLDMMLFCYLFFKSSYIPKFLAGFGVLSFALVFIHAVSYILAPKFAIMPITQTVFWAPSGLFEIIIGFWLLVKGLKVQQAIEEA